ncbi:hypothetical protein COHA_010658 [Chlorella ohadii]|uniref:Uncharacterized protein n=1 Tax=Chlorella ohadii TaxID=2649997 RepID=A0AAD5DFW6_9CHLO|nr:hypothetical protein COHA_010658 [Chlorella ohadii]
MVSLDDQILPLFVAPPTGLRTAPLLVPTAPAAYGACTGDAWRATATHIDVNAGVADCFAGLDTEQCHQRWTATTEARLTAGWSSGEAAVQFFEAWCALVARRRPHFSAPKFQAAAEAAAGHEQLSAAQLGRLLAAEAALPADLTTTVNAWLAGWTAGVAGRRAALVRAQAKAATTTAVRGRRATARSAAGAVELAQGAPALAAFA